MNATSRQLLRHFEVSQKDRQFLEEHFGDGRLWTIPNFGVYLQKHAPSIRAKKNMYPRILESLALGHYQEQVDFPAVETLLSDDAPKYAMIALWLHALCWIHDVRHCNKLTPKIEVHRSAKEAFQNKYWKFHYQLLDFKELPGVSEKSVKSILKQQFKSLFKPSTGYFQLNE